MCLLRLLVGFAHRRNRRLLLASVNSTCRPTTVPVTRPCPNAGCVAALLAASTSSSVSRIACNASWARDFTVPAETPRRAAASATVDPRQWHSSRTCRHSGDNRRSASAIAASARARAPPTSALPSAEKPPIRNVSKENDSLSDKTFAPSGCVTSPGRFPANASGILGHRLEIMTWPFPSYGPLLWAMSDARSTACQIGGRLLRIRRRYPGPAHRSGDPDRPARRQGPVQSRNRPSPTRSSRAGARATACA
ncbi:MAG: hypothetical protein QOE89_647 [Pseudonocardiales bacterium]|nr:hypothetical protein [Pseudonocardiales bacterium]